MHNMSLNSIKPEERSRGTNLWFEFSKIFMCCCPERGEKIIPDPVRMTRNRCPSLSPSPQPRSSRVHFYPSDAFCTNNLISKRAQVIFETFDCYSNFKIVQVGCFVDQSFGWTRQRRGHRRFDQRHPRRQPARVQKRIPNRVRVERISCHASYHVQIADAAVQSATYQSPCTDRRLMRRNFARMKF